MFTYLLQATGEVTYVGCIDRSRWDTQLHVQRRSRDRTGHEPRHCPAMSAAQLGHDYYYYY